MNELVGKRVFLLEPIDDIETYVDQLKIYKDSGCELTVGPFVTERDKGYTKEQLIEIGNTYDAVIGMSREKFTKEVIMASERLKMITKTGIGMDHVDIAAATEKGIVVTNTPGQNGLSVAEHAITLILALLKKLPYEDKHLRAGFWRDGGTLSGEIYKSTIGIVGYGHIGRMVAKRLQGWDCDLIAYDPYVTQEQANETGFGVKMVDWKTLFSTSDVVTVHTPLNAETRGLVDAKALGMMKETAYLVNTARGPVVDIAALSEAVHNGQIAGAGIDTHTPEPVGEAYPLLDLHDNVILTPHNAGWAGPALARLAVVAAQNTVEVLCGKLNKNVCNPEVEKLWRKRFSF